MGYTIHILYILILSVYKLKGEMNIRLLLSRLKQRLGIRSLSPTADLEASMKTHGLEPDVVRSLRLMLVSNILGVICANICATGSSPMIGMANDLGAGDLAFGILNAVPQVTVLLQIPAAMLVNYTHRRKRYLLTYGILSRVLWLMVGLIPIIVPEKIADFRMWAVLFLVGIASSLNSLIQVSWFPWLGDLTPPTMRSTWLSTRDSINALVSIISGLSTGFLMDHLSGYTRYIVLFAIGGTAGILDMLMYAGCKEVYSAPPVKPSLKAMGSGIFDNGQFRHFLTFWTMWCFCANFVGSYINRYAINELGITYTQMTIFGTITSNIVSMIAVRMWSHLAIRYGFKPVLRIAATGASLVQLLFMLARPHEVWPIMLYYGVGSIFWSGTNLVASNLQLSLTNDENRAGALAVFGCVTAILGTFCGIMLGGSLLEFLEGKTLPLSLNRYQCAILCAVTMRFTTAMVMIPGFENDRQFTTSGMIRDILGLRRKLPGKKAE